MTAQLDLHPDTGHPSLACVQEIHEALDRADPAHRPLPSGEYAALVGECQRAISRLEGLKLRLIADTDRAQVASLSAMSGTDAWTAKRTRTSPREAAKAVRLAGPWQTATRPPAPRSLGAI